MACCLGIVYLDNALPALMSRSAAKQPQICWLDPNGPNTTDRSPGALRRVGQGLAAYAAQHFPCTPDSVGAFPHQLRVLRLLLCAAIKLEDFQPLSGCVLRWWCKHHMRRGHTSYDTTLTPAIAQWTISRRSRKTACLRGRKRTFDGGACLAEPGCK